MNRLRLFAKALTRMLFVVGNILLLCTIPLWYLDETGRLSISGLEPLNVGIAAIVGYLGALLAWLANKGESREQRSKDQAYRNRQQLIQNVKATWIEGVRNQALNKSAWIELGLTLEPDHVDSPINTVWRADEEIQPIPKNTPILETFREQAANTLLILGAPGSGKTITLLDLAQQLIDEAEQDPKAPVPVVFNLTTWATKRRPLEEWLIEELNRTYQVPIKIGQSWLKNDALVLLLDGLDEVAMGARQACASRINAYRQTHGLTGIAVCSRLEEYQALSTQLKLLGAIVIQPLTLQQANVYLQKMGGKLKAVRKLLTEDDKLQEWVTSPLFLYVVSIAYRGLSLPELRQTHTGNLNRLYDIYVTQLLEKHRAHQKYPYTPEKIRKWLAFLAHQLTKRNQIIYRIEHMQFDWVDILDNNRRYSHWLKRRLRKMKITIRDRQWSWGVASTEAKSGLLFGIVFGLIIGLIIGVFFAFDNWMGNNYVNWWGSNQHVLNEDGQIFELVHKQVNWMFDGLGDGLVIWIVVGLLDGLVFGMVAGLPLGFVRGLVYGQVFGDARPHEKPNQGVWRTAANGLLFGLLFGLVVGLIIEAYSGLVVEGFSDLVIRAYSDFVVKFFSWLLDGLAFGAFSGLVVGLFFGLADFIKHFLLRSLLAYYKHFPYRLIPFLEFAKSRLFLQRVGGNYIFIHRTLLDYFAAQHPSAQSSDDPTT